VDGSERRDMTPGRAEDTLLMTEQRGRERDRCRKARGSEGERDIPRG
jgi:hypothetical protein